MNKRPPTLHPIHWSIRDQRPRPYNMDRIILPRELAEFADRMALEIFTDMVNSGAPFAEALAAIYVSGLQHAVAVSQHKADC